MIRLSLRRVCQGIAVLAISYFPIQSANALTTSYHIGNSLTIDGLGNNSGNVQNGTFGLEAMAQLYGYNHKVAMHIDSSQALRSIRDNPAGVGGDGIDVKRNPWGGWSNALPNYEWSHVTFEPYLKEDVTLGTDKEDIGFFIDLTRQNAANHDTIFYVYQVWPRQSWGDYNEYWEAPVEFDDDSPTRPRKNFYSALMSDLHTTYTPQGIVIREIPTGEVWNQVAHAIDLGQITGISMSNFYRDDLHGSGLLGRYLAAATQFSVMFQTDVRGMVPPVQQFGTTYPQSLYDQLNEIIWSVVSSNSYTGIADFNDDGYVSAADRLIWQNAYGNSVAGDTDGDGDTDGRDFLNWQRNYGGEPPLPIVGSVVAIPEPSTLIFLAAFAVFISLILRPL